jgi:hypothetical protein
VRRSLVIALLALACAAPAAAAAPGQAMTFEAPSELLDDVRRDAALDEIRAFGVTRVRVLVYWEQFAPAPGDRVRPVFDAADPAAYPAGTWDRLDRLFESAELRGIAVQPTLTGPVPRWATKARRDRVTEPLPAEFELWATAVARRYAGQAVTWSIWNEPNHPQFLLPQFRSGHAASPRLYRRLFLAGLRGLRAGGVAEDAAVLAGETAPRGTPRVVAPLAFLRGVLCLDSRYRRTTARCDPLPAAGWAHHAYTTAAGPRFRPSARDDVTIGVLSRLTKALDRAARAGAVAKKLPVHLTEFGIQSEPDPYAGVSFTRQAEYLGIAERIAWRNPRVASFSQYLLRDDQPRPGPRASRYGGFESGLRLADGTAKPAYDAFRLPLAVDLRGSRATIWGIVRPAEGATTATLLGSVKGGWTELRSVATDEFGAFAVTVTHRSGRRYRLRWTSPDGVVREGAPIRAF